MTLLGSEAVTANNDNLSPVTEPINAGRGEQGIAKEGRPFAGRTVGGQQNTALFITRVDDIVQIAGGRGLKGLEAKVIEDQQVWPQVGFEATLPRIIGAAAVQMLEQLVDVNEDHVKALPTGSLGQGLS
jgi:hypothetical protein